MTFAAYASSIFPEGLSINIQKLLAAALLIMLTGIHATNHKNSSGTRVIFTLMKIGVILAFVFGTLIAVDTPPPVSFLPAEGDFAIITSGAYAVALIYVSFAYTGWNAATYLSSELRTPTHASLILISGTAVVTLLYLGLNFSFLYAAPMDLMAVRLK